VTVALVKTNGLRVDIAYRADMQIGQEAPLLRQGGVLASVLNRTLRRDTAMGDHPV